MKNKIIILTGVVVLGVISYLGMQKLQQKKLAFDPYQKIESPISLNEAQKSELPKLSGEGISIYRYQSSEGQWEVGEGRPNASAKEVLQLGILFPKSAEKEVAVPVFLCAYPSAQGQNTSFAADARCGGEGKLVQAKPIGYASEKIRTGFRMMVRCKSKSRGFYPSLNSNCESPDDRIEGLVGSVMAI